MTNIVFLSNGQYPFIQKSFELLFSSHGILEISSSNIITNSYNSESIVSITDNLKQLINKGIVIFTPNSSIKYDGLISDDTVCIVNSNDKNSIEYICNNRLSAVTCGLSDKDTFTISGASEDQVSVCLQRTITTLSGNVIDPREFVINLSRQVPLYNIMAVIAIITLTDNVNLLDNITI